jgi:hypothetical protein
MRLCGKRLFTLVCKRTSTADRRGETRIKNSAVRQLPGRIFFCCGGEVILQGVLEKRGVLCVVFRGEVVVSCW